MKNIRIDYSVYEKMLELAKLKSPVEACAILGGKDDLVSLFIEMTNADNAAEHFSLLPEEQFAAIKTLRSEGLKMLGIWHSHPATPARMSEEDLRLAYTDDVAYMILSLEDQHEPVLKAFNVVDGKPYEVSLKIGEYNEH